MSTSIVTCSEIPETMDVPYIDEQLAACDVRFSASLPCNSPFLIAVLILISSPLFISIYMRPCLYPSFRVPLSSYLPASLDRHFPLLRVILPLSSLTYLHLSFPPSLFPHYNMPQNSA